MATIAISAATLAAAHGLSERPADRRVRKQAIRFNLVTVIKAPATLRMSRIAMVYGSERHVRTLVYLARTFEPTDAESGVVTHAYI